MGQSSHYLDVIEGARGGGGGGGGGGVRVAGRLVKVCTIRNWLTFSKVSKTTPV